MSNLDQTVVEVQSAKTLAETSISNALSSVKETTNVLEGVKQGVDAASAQPLVNRELKDLQTRLLLKYFMLDIDIFNSSDSVK